MINKLTKKKTHLHLSVANQCWQQITQFETDTESEHLTIANIQLFRKNSCINQLKKTKQKKN